MVDAPRVGDGIIYIVTLPHASHYTGFNHILPVIHTLIP